MNVVGRLKAILGLDNSQFKSGLKDSEKSTNIFSNSIKKLGGLIGGAFAIGKIVSFTKASMEAYNTQVQAEQKLANALKMNGKNADVLLPKYKKLASGIQQITTVGDETTLGLLQLAESMQAPDIEGATKGAIGLSKALGIDMQSALKMVVLAQNEEYTMLQRYIPALRSATTNAEKAAIVQKTLADGFELAKVEAQTGTGQMQQLSNTWGDMKEQVGSLASSIINELAPALNKITQQATGELQNLNTLIESDKLTGWQKLGTFMNFVQGHSKELAAAATELNKVKEEENKQLEEENKQLENNSTVVPSVVKNIAWYKEEIDRLTKSLDDLLPSQQAQAIAINNQISEYKALVDGIKDARVEMENMEKISTSPFQIDTEEIKGKLADVSNSFVSQQKIQQVQAQAHYDLLGNLVNGYYDNQLTKASETFSSIGQLMTGMSDLFTQLKENEIAQAEATAKSKGKSDEWLAKKKAAINKKYAQKQKNLALAQAIINTAQGVTKALADGGFFGIATGALVAAAGAIEIATISSQGLAKGGIVPAGFPNDTYPASLTSGEMVIPPKKLPDIISNQSGGELTTRIDGRYLEIVLNRWQKDKSRMT